MSIIATAINRVPPADIAGRPEVKISSHMRRTARPCRNGRGHCAGRDLRARARARQGRRGFDPPHL